MDTMTTEEIIKFNAHFKGHSNIMTPKTLENIKIKNYLIEISTGKFMDFYLCGVTVLKILDDGTLTDPDLSKSFDSLNNAYEYIKTL